MSLATAVSLGLGIWGAGLSTFILVRGLIRDRHVDAESKRRDELIAVLDRLTRECRTFDVQFYHQLDDATDAYEAWLPGAERDIAKLSQSFATEFAKPDPRLALPARVKSRLELLEHIRRAVIAPGCHLGPGSGD